MKRFFSIVAIFLFTATIVYAQTNCAIDGLLMSRTGRREVRGTSIFYESSCPRGHISWVGTTYEELYTCSSGHEYWREDSE